MADEDEKRPADEPPAKETKYDQAFFLDLAAKGKDTWNAWPRDPVNKDMHGTFASVDFSEAPLDLINFADSNSATMRIFRDANGLSKRV